MVKHGLHSVSFGWCELFKRCIGGRGIENKNKFEKLTDPSQKERKFVPSADERICLGCLRGPQLASTSGNFKAISSSSLSFGGEIGGKGRRGVSDPKCNQ